MVGKGIQDDIDLGKLPDIESARERGLRAGATAVDVVDAREDFLRFFAFPGLADL